MEVSYVFFHLSYCIDDIFICIQAYLHFKMSEVLRKDTTYSNRNESGPDYFAYYKHLVLHLLSQDRNFVVPFVEVDSVGKHSAAEAKGSCYDHKGRTVNRFCGSGSYFTESVGERLSEFRKERLMSTLCASATHFNMEADEVYFVNRIILREKCSSETHQEVI